MASSLKNKFASAALGLLASIPLAHAAILPYPYYIYYKSEVGTADYTVSSDGFTKKNQTINSATFTAPALSSGSIGEVTVTIYNNISLYDSSNQTFAKHDGFKFYDGKITAFAYGGTDIIETMNTESVLYILGQFNRMPFNRGVQAAGNSTTYELYDFRGYGMPTPGTSTLLGAGLMAAGLRRRRPTGLAEFSGV